ncbi:hypothetical protein [Enterococcus entomosocium]|uniref:hypothetical protein n=1 Tax=Enterococcus entomosocium TaxID=3034352 RepID=UPI002649C061|nr:hypothetical protein [Enterococcus entomosocium]
MLSIEEEKRIIYELMRELIIERRELSKHYYELKQQLDDLGSNDLLENKEHRPMTVLEKEKIRESDYFHRNNKNSHHISFDRISKNILSVLKESPVPLSNKQIAEKLTTEYELNVNYSNLTSNILPKMLKERSLPIEKAYRGYWQYRLPKV